MPMEWKKPTSAMLEAFANCAPTGADIEHRSMFGCPCCFVHGQMFFAVHGEGLVVRLPEAEREELLAVEGASPFVPMPNRVMREYVVVPEAMWHSPDALGPWVDRAYRFARSLPPKEKKAPAKKARRST